MRIPATHSGQVETLKGMGLSPGDYTAYTVALTLAIMVVCLAVSTFIVWRRSYDRMALLVALMLVTLGQILETIAVPNRPSSWQVPYECLTFLFLVLFMLVFSLFPAGSSCRASHVGCSWCFLSGKSLSSRIHP